MRPIVVLDEAGAGADQHQSADAFGLLAGHLEGEQSAERPAAENRSGGKTVDDAPGRVLETAQIGGSVPITGQVDVMHVAAGRYGRHDRLPGGTAQSPAVDQRQ